MAFYADDELNSKTADEMGVIIGTSHHEPMHATIRNGHVTVTNTESGTITQIKKYLTNSLRKELKDDRVQKTL